MLDEMTWSQPRVVVAGLFEILRGLLEPAPWGIRQPVTRLEDLNNLILRQPHSGSQLWYRLCEEPPLLLCRVALQKSCGSIREPGVELVVRRFLVKG